MTTDNTSQKARQPNVGERLRKAREAAGYTIAEVADRQHLRPAVITAIEKGDYRQVDSELFLKGYVRAYAAQVGVDPDSVVRQLDQELEPLREERQAKVEANPLVTIERRKRRKRQIARIVAVLVVLAVLFYAGSLYLARQQPVSPDPVTDPADDLAPADDEDAELLTPEPEQDDEQAAEGPGPDPQESPAEDEPQAGSDAAVGDDSPVSGPEPGVAATGDEDLLDEDSQPTAPGSGAGESEPEPAPEAAIVSEPLEEPETTTATEGDNRLVVEFSGDCWVEVQDRTGRTLVASLRSAGDTLSVSGEPPLRVVLGAVNAVSSLRYDGEAVDLSDRRTRNNRLVLTLPD